MTDFKALLVLLSRYQVEFIVIGGAAARAHGSATLTQDLDVVYGRSEQNLARLVHSLASHKPYLRGAPPGLPFSFDVETVKRGLNFTLTTDLGDLDLLGEVTGGGRYEDLLPHTMELRLYGIPCKCVRLRKLIELKRAAGRPRDLNAIAELEALYEEQERKKS